MVIQTTDQNGWIRTGGLVKGNTKLKGEWKMNNKANVGTWLKATNIATGRVVTLMVTRTSSITIRLVELGTGQQLGRVIQFPPTASGVTLEGIKAYADLKGWELSKPSEKALENREKYGQ